MSLLLQVALILLLLLGKLQEGQLPGLIPREWCLQSLGNEVVGIGIPQAPIMSRWHLLS